jgi:FkbM family methyltransferase
MTPLSRIWNWMHRRQIRGRHRINSLVAGFTGAPPLVRAKTKYGATLLLNPYEYVDSFILRHGFYESEVFEALRPHLMKGGAFWDIGSNTGLHGISAKVCFPDVDVSCFEPVPLLANRIVEHAKLNNVSVAVYAGPLGTDSRPTWITMTPGNLGMSHVDSVRDRTVPSILTTTQTGDALVQGMHLTSPSVVKIDAEGAEQAILGGMANCLGTVKAIAFEAGVDVLADKTHPIRLALDPLGFHYRQLTRAEPTAHNLENFIAER